MGSGLNSMYPGSMPMLLTQASAAHSTASTSSAPKLPCIKRPVAQIPAPMAVPAMASSAKLMVGATKPNTTMAAKASTN